jgi:hypothetical protein
MGPALPHELDRDSAGITDARARHILAVNDVPVKHLRKACPSRTSGRELRITIDGWTLTVNNCIAAGHNRRNSGRFEFRLQPTIKAGIAKTQKKRKRTA